MKNNKTADRAELKVFYKDGTNEIIKASDFIFIGIEKYNIKDKKTIINLRNKVTDIFNSHVVLENIDKIKKNLNESILNCKVEKAAFDLTNKIFSIFDKEGIEGVEKAYKNGVFGDLSEKDFKIAYNLLKDVKQDEIIKDDQS